MGRPIIELIYERGHFGPADTRHTAAALSFYAIGLAGYILLLLGFHPAPVLLGFVLGPRLEENFRVAMLMSSGDLTVFVERPISAVFLALSAFLLAVQIYFRLDVRRWVRTLFPMRRPARMAPSSST